MSRARRAFRIILSFKARRACNKCRELLWEVTAERHNVVIISTRDFNYHVFPMCPPDRQERASNSTMESWRAIAAHRSVSQFISIILQQLIARLFAIIHYPRGCTSHCFVRTHMYMYVHVCIQRVADLS